VEGQRTTQVLAIARIWMSAAPSPPHDVVRSGDRVPFGGIARKAIATIL
jgi:hypothetical protein